ncbi:hypothetical protein EVAR_79696_1 [Eumeta japonica]|uniref:Uncharacterized protein n=1 Tax=Eumeta variegata TaxID=151549 RepID=A0A4C1TC73_EUMVA|nr:hypothetical protein EVAR_79696_1 [Eumeta japonica]
MAPPRRTIMRQKQQQAFKRREEAEKPQLLPSPERSQRRRELRLSVHSYSILLDQADSYGQELHQPSLKLRLLDTQNRTLGCTALRPSQKHGAENLGYTEQDPWVIKGYAKGKRSDGRRCAFRGLHCDALNKKLKPERRAAAPAMRRRGRPVSCVGAIALYIRNRKTIVEIRKAADELFQLSEMDVKACNQAKETKNERETKEHTFPLYLLTHYSIYYLSRIQFLAKGCTNTGWLYTPVTPNPS